jgi:hydroxymethylpyrimidine pyrophosphatase-like HAD family hydrolase
VNALRRPGTVWNPASESEAPVPLPIPDGPLVVCDLDGTLLRSDGTMSAYTRATLRGLAAAGVAFTVATARSLPGFAYLVTDVEFPLPVVEMGGTYLSDAATGRHLVHHGFDTTTAADVVAALLAAGIEPTIASWDGGADRLHHGPLGDAAARRFVEEHRGFRDPRLCHSPDLVAVARTEQVAVIRFGVPHDRMEQARALLADVGGGRTAVQVYPIGLLPGWAEVAVHGALADKGRGIRVLRERHGLTGPVVACGDGLNDLPMFAVADRRVAPANAHPEILALATDVVGTNDEDGVARFLAAEFLAPRPADERPPVVRPGAAVPDTPPDTAAARPRG